MFLALWVLCSVLRASPAEFTLYPRLPQPRPCFHDDASWLWISHSRVVFPVLWVLCSFCFELFASFLALQLWIWSDCHVLTQNFAIPLWVLHKRGWYSLKCFENLSVSAEKEGKGSECPVVRFYIYNPTFFFNQLKACKGLLKNGCCRLLALGGHPWGVHSAVDCSRDLSILLVRSWALLLYSPNDFLVVSWGVGPSTGSDCPDMGPLPHLFSLPLWMVTAFYTALFFFKVCAVFWIYSESCIIWQCLHFILAFCFVFIIQAAVPGRSVIILCQLIRDLGKKNAAI